MTNDAVVQLFRDPSVLGYTLEQFQFMHGAKPGVILVTRDRHRRHELQHRLADYLLRAQLATGPVFPLMGSDSEDYEDSAESEDGSDGYVGAEANSSAASGRHNVDDDDDDDDIGDITKEEKAYLKALRKAKRERTQS